MALFNVSTSGATLAAIGYPAHATSELILQDGGDTDFESIRETRVHWNLANISTAASTADTCITNTTLVNGDRIFIRKNNGSIVDTFVTGASSEESTVVPNMTSNTVPEGVASGANTASESYFAFDGNDATATHVYNYQWIQYQFKDNTPTLINRYAFKATDSSGGWTIEGSVDGVNFSTISTQSAIDTRTKRIYTIESPGEFSVYRFNPNSDFSGQVYCFDLLGDGVSIDTSAITLGEVPDQVFKFEDTISFNGATAIEKDIFYEYGTAGTALYALTLYEDVTLTGRQIQTRVDFSASGNKSVEITGQIYKAL